MNAGVIKCQHCDYVRKVKDYAIAPEWQCPKCKCDYEDIKSDDSSSSAGNKYIFVFIFIITIFLALILGNPFVGIIPILYFFPTLIALNYNHQSTVSIFALNLFLGCTFIGWVISLVWSLNTQGKSLNNNIQISSYDELEKLAELRDRGILTEEEFLNKKKLILKCRS